MLKIYTFTITDFDESLMLIMDLYDFDDIKPDFCFSLANSIVNVRHFCDLMSSLGILKNFHCHGHKSLNFGPIFKNFCLTFPFYLLNNHVARPHMARNVS